VSRPEIKKYAKETYELDSTRAHVSWLNRAISSGVEDGVFVQPKVCVIHSLKSAINPQLPL
jgi:hypothetical protein